VNDTTAAILDRRAGIPQNEENRRVEFNVRRKANRLLGLLLSALINDSATFRFAKSLQHRLWRTAAVPGPPIALARLSKSDQTQLVEQVVNWYAQNVKVVEMLGREYRFEPMFYWQPVLFTKPNRGALEQQELSKYSWAESIFLDVDQSIANDQVLNSDTRWHNISRIFGDSADVLYTDFCHTTERGNAIVAKAMADDLVAMQPPRKTATAAPFVPLTGE
jgi:hypothetical protein